MLHEIAEMRLALMEAYQELARWQQDSSFADGSYKPIAHLCKSVRIADHPNYIAIPPLRAPNFPNHAAIDLRHFIGHSNVLLETFPADLWAWCVGITTPAAQEDPQASAVIAQHQGQESAGDIFSDENTHWTHCGARI